MGAAQSRDHAKQSRDKYTDESRRPPIDAWSDDDVVRTIALACSEGDLDTLRAIVDARGDGVLELRDRNTVNAGPLLRVPLAESYVIRMSNSKRDPGMAGRHGGGLHGAASNRPSSNVDTMGSSTSSRQSVGSSSRADTGVGLPPAHLAPGRLVLHGAFMNREEKIAQRAQRRETQNQNKNSSLTEAPLPLSLSPSAGHAGDSAVDTERSANNSVSPSLVQVEDVPTTPLIAACRHGRKDVVNFLVEHGACIDEVWAQTTPLIEAVRHEYEIISRLLLFRGASVATNEESDAQENGAYSDLERIPPESSALHVCVQVGDKSMLQTMLDECPFVDIRRQSDGFTPLHVAAESNNVFAAKELVDHGADLDAKNNAGLTPVELASERGQWEVVGLLKMANLGGPEVKAKRRRGRQSSCLCF